MIFLRDGIQQMIILGDDVQQRKHSLLATSDFVKIKDHNIQLISNILADKNPDQIKLEPAFIELLVYLELGLPYDAHQALFDQLLTACQMTREEISHYYSTKEMTLFLTKANLQKAFHWRIPKGMPYQGNAITQILKLCRENKIGDYPFKDTSGFYLLHVTDTTQHQLEHLVKGITYTLIDRIPPKKVRSKNLRDKTNQ